VQGFAAKM
jgi:hypothetical protein